MKLVLQMVNKCQYDDEIGYIIFIMVKIWLPATLLNTNATKVLKASKFVFVLLKSNWKECANICKFDVHIYKFDVPFLNYTSNENVILVLLVKSNLAVSLQEDCMTGTNIY